MGEVLSYTAAGIEALIAEALATGGVGQEAIDAAVAALVDSAPGTLDTLNELAAALGDDPNFATTIAASIAASGDEAVVGAAIVGEDLVFTKGDATTFSVALPAGGDGGAALDAHIADTTAVHGIADTAALSIAASSAGVVVHGAVAGTARIAGYGTVIWVGSVEPTNAVNGDLWIDTTS